MVDVPILGRIKTSMAFRVAFVIAFLVFIMAVPIFTIEALRKYNPIYPFIFTVAVVAISLVVSLVLHEPPFYKDIKRALIGLIFFYLPGIILTLRFYARGDFGLAASCGFVSILGIGLFMASLYKFLKIRR